MFAPLFPWTQRDTFLGYFHILGTDEADSDPWVIVTDVCRCGCFNVLMNFYIFNLNFIAHTHTHTHTHTHITKALTHCGKCPWSRSVTTERHRHHLVTHLNYTPCVVPSPPTQWALCVSQCADQSASVSPASEPGADRDDRRGVVPCGSDRISAHVGAGSVLFCSVRFGSVVAAAVKLRIQPALKGPASDPDPPLFDLSPSCVRDDDQQQVQEPRAPVR